MRILQLVPTSCLYSAWYLGHKLTRCLTFLPPHLFCHGWTVSSKTVSQNKAASCQITAMRKTDGLSSVVRKQIPETRQKGHEAHPSKYRKKVKHGGQWQGSRSIVAFVPWDSSSRITCSSPNQSFRIIVPSYIANRSRCSS